MRTKFCAIPITWNAVDVAKNVDENQRKREDAEKIIYEFLKILYEFSEIYI